jgi:hypothetical protein
MHSFYFSVASQLLETSVIDVNERQANNQRQQSSLHHIILYFVLVEQPCRKVGCGDHSAIGCEHGFYCLAHFKIHKQEMIKKGKIEPESSIYSEIKAFSSVRGTRLQLARATKAAKKMMPNVSDACFLFLVGCAVRFSPFNFPLTLLIRHKAHVLFL